MSQMGHIGHMSFSLVFWTDRINITEHQSEVNIKFFIDHDKFFIRNKVSGFAFLIPVMVSLADPRL